MRLLLLTLLIALWASTMFAWAAKGQVLLPVLSFLFKTFEMQMKRSTQNDLMVSEPPPDLTELCKLAGLRSCKRHEVCTDDGFILELHHIPSAVTDAVPVLVMHGCFATSDGFLLRRDNSNLAYVLHEAGCDVWLGNWRGSTHSTRHVHFNSSDAKLQEFRVTLEDNTLEMKHGLEICPYFLIGGILADEPVTLGFKRKLITLENRGIHELGVFDLPALVDFIIEKTGQPSLHYIGHSMASPALLAGLSSRPEYNAKIRFAALMAPVVWPRGFLPAMLIALYDTFYPEFYEFVKLYHLWNLTPRTTFIHYFAESFCKDSSPSVNVCRKMWEVVFGATHPTQRMKEFFPHVGATHPAGCSFTILYHYITVAISDRFRPLGKGARDPHPPAEYNLTAVTTPVGLYYGATDGLMSVKDMDPLGRALGNLEESYLVPMDMFSHLDFLWATDVRGVLYDHIIKTMKTVDLRRPT